MPRTTIHVCSACGAESAQWHGQCPGCEAWNTLVEEAVAPRAGRGSGAGARGKGAARRAGTSRAGEQGAGGEVIALRDVAAARGRRLSTGIGELDRVLGGGLVPGSLVLLGGSPGIGKS